MIIPGLVALYAPGKDPPGGLAELPPVMLT